MPTERQPKRAVIDPRLEMSLDAVLLKQPGLIVFCGEVPVERQERLRHRGAVVVCMPLSQQPDRVDLVAVMRWLGQEQINEIHVEAGAGLNGALWQAGCADELLLYLAPVFLGHGQPMLKLPGIDQLSEAHRLTFIDQREIDGDIRVRARRLDRWQQLLDAVDLANRQAQARHT